MELLGHALFLLSIFFAFLAMVLAVLLAEALTGGRISKAAIWEAAGLIFIAIGIFLTYTGAITGKLDLLDVTVFWPGIGFILFIGFAFVCYGKWQMMKVI